MKLRVARGALRLFVRRCTPICPVFLLRCVGGPVLVVLVACVTSMAPPRARYRPRARELTVTTVPLLVQEQQKLFPFLKPAFSKGGVLVGKEVYAFSPSTLVVVAGDTIRFTFVNPEDDVHSFVLPDFAVQLPGGKETRAVYIAKRAGIFPFFCSIPSHLPMMWGQLVVLEPAAAGPLGDTASPGGALVGDTH